MVQRTTRPEGESLDDLAGEAAELDAQLGGDGVQPPGTDLAVTGPPPPSNAAMLAAAITIGRDTFCSFTKLESPKRTLADDQVTKLADAWGAVLDKHGIDLSKYMGDYALEFAAIVVTFQIASEVRTAVRAEIAAQEAARTVASAETTDDQAQG